MFDGLVDPITFEVVRHRLWAINDEAGATIKRVTGSPIAYGGDFNTGILTAAGEMLLVGVYISSHASVQDLIVKYLLTEYRDNPGIKVDDMFITNDPYIGALHQPDVTCIAPVHWEGELVAWCGATVHQVDVGGPTPGSFVIGAKSIFEEGTPMPPVKVVEGGILRKDIEREYLRRSRIPDLVALDLRAQVAANNTVKSRMHKLIQQYGLDAVKAVMTEMIGYVEKRFRARLRELPDGTWRHRIFLDHDGVENKIYPCLLAMTKEADRLTFDFREAAQQAGAVINCCYSSLRGAVMASTLPLLCYDMPWTPAGLWRAIELISKPGTVLDAQWPAGISMSTITGAWAARTAVNVCLGKIMASSEQYKDHAMSAWSGSTQMQTLYGLNQRREPFFCSAGAKNGGAGARTYKDGVDNGGIISSMSGIVVRIETTEYFYPILHLYCRRLEDSGGPGMFRGGVGAESALTPHDAPEPLVISVYGWGVEAPASAGIYGGYAGSTYQSVIKRNTDIEDLFREGRMPNKIDEIAGKLDVLPIMHTTRLNRGDILAGTSSGGGGYGDPLDRDPLLVAQDVAAHLVSLEWAGKIYGVALDPAGGLLEAETRKRRQRLIRKRLAGIKQGAGSPLPEAAYAKPASEYIEVAQSQGRAALRCRKCKYAFGSPQDNYKNHASVKEYPVSRAGPHINPYQKSKRFVLREFCCPQCGTLMEVEINIKGDPYVWDIQLDRKT